MTSEDQSIEESGALRSHRWALAQRSRAQSGALARSCRVLFALAFLLSCALAAGSSVSAGSLYKYVDERGVVHFTNMKPMDRRFRPVESSPGRLAAFPAGPRETRFDGLIGSTARAHRLSPALVKAVVAAESNFDPGAVSRKGATGLMQLMPATARALGVSDPLRPEQNVRGGVRYLRSLIDRFGDLEQALAAYNAGPTAVHRHGGIPPFPETRDYVAKVLTYYRQYDDHFGR